MFGIFLVLGQPSFFFWGGGGIHRGFGGVWHFRAPLDRPYGEVMDQRRVGIQGKKVFEVTTEQEQEQARSTEDAEPNKGCTK